MPRIEYHLLYAAGLSFSEIGNLFGVSRQAVQQTIRFELTRSVGHLRTKPKSTNANERRFRTRLLREIGSILTDWSTLRIAEALGIRTKPGAHVPGRRHDPTLFVSREQEVYQLRKSGLSYANIRFLTGLTNNAISCMAHRAEHERVRKD